MRALTVSLALLACLAGCDDGLTLAVDVRTDMVPGIEFVRVETSLLEEPTPGAPVTTRAQQELTVDPGEDFAGGVRVAELGGLAPGEQLVRVRFYGARGALVLERAARVTLTADQVITVLLTRDCRGVECPAPSAPDLAACLAGRCVDERCLPESMDACPEPACASDADCPGGAPCARAACEEGVCWLEADDATCAGGDYCDPDVGCTPIDATLDGGPDAGPGDAGVDDAGGDMDAGPCGMPCAGPEECRTYAFDCATDPPVCAARGEVESGQTCGAGGEVCDGLGACRGVLADALRVDVGGAHACAVLAGGRVACWGDNAQGAVGPVTRVIHAEPVLVAGITDAIDVCAGRDHSCALSAGGQVLCWGVNDYGQLGDGTRIGHDDPRPVLTISAAESLDCGHHMGCVVDSGRLLCWGFGRDGQLGTGGTSDELSPVAIAGLPARPVQVSTDGELHTCVRLDDGSVACWGRNDVGQLGTGGEPTAAPGDPVVGIDDAIQVATAANTSCALLSDGSLACWGRNALHQLGMTGGDFHVTPVALTGFPAASQIALGAGHTCVLARDGSGERCVGVGAPLGDGTTTGSDTPVAVGAPGPDFTVIAAGGGHPTLDRRSCGIRGATPGELYCWGSNGSGGVGDGTLSVRTRPVPVLPLP